MSADRFVLLFKDTAYQVPCLASAVQLVFDIGDEGFETCLFFDAAANTATVVDLSDDLDELRQVLNEMESHHG